MEEERGVDERMGSLRRGLQYGDDLLALGGQGMSVGRVREGVKDGDLRGLCLRPSRQSIARRTCGLRAGHHPSIS